ncbi:hypothetical protein EOB49_32870 [Mesorhizobium sp. M7A.F.Ca.MR.148.00.0.0]|nr:hypothetical protein EOB49_32870 [Mesorhizobium sp. M7A.F.Ca.MR.148.00.0.0]
MDACLPFRILGQADKGCCLARNQALCVVCSLEAPRAPQPSEIRVIDEAVDPTEQNLFDALLFHQLQRTLQQPDACGSAPVDRPRSGMEFLAGRHDDRREEVRRRNVSVGRMITKAFGRSEQESRS